MITKTTIEKINMQHKVNNALDVISLFHRYHFSLAIFLVTQFLQAISINSISFLTCSCINIIMLMILIKISIPKKINGRMKLFKDFLIILINTLTIVKLFFDFEDGDRTSMILDLTLGEILFLKACYYKSSEMFSIIIFSLSLLINFQIQDFQLLYVIVSIFLIMITIANEIKINKICLLCQSSSTDLFFSLNEDFQKTSENYNLKKYRKENKISFKIFVQTLLKNQICLKKEYPYKPEIKEIISDILMDIEQSEVINLENYLKILKNKKEKKLYCLGKIDFFQNKNEVIYISKKKKGFLIKIKREKAFKEALNLGSLTKNYVHTIYYIAHELRNLLNCILNLELIDFNEKYSFETLNTEFLQPAIISSKLMLNIVSGLLDFAQIEANTFKLLLSKFDIRELIDEIMKIYKIQTKNRGLSMEVYVDPDVNKIQSDPNRVKQILINLISNAIKYTKSGKITVKVQKLNFSQIQISIIDTGLGIEEKNLNKLFHAFSKIQNKEDSLLNDQGIGLGLLISNQLADLLNKSEGGITVSSKLKHGSEFSFNIYDMKSDEDDEISISSRKVLSFSSPPCKLIKNRKETIIAKENLEQSSSTLFSNHFESESLNKSNDIYKIYVSSDDCMEIDKKIKSNRNEDSGKTSSKKRIESIFMITEDRMKSSQREKLRTALSINSEENIHVENDPQFKIRQKEKSATAIENEPTHVGVNREDDIFIFSLNKIAIRSKEKSITAVDTKSTFIQKRIEKIKKKFESKGCICPVALIIDDNDFNILSLKTHLKKFSMSCESALSGEIALKKIYKIHENDCCKYYKYIFLDLEMPEKNGLAVYKEICDYYKNFGLVDSMIIMNTGYSKSSDIVKNAFSKGVKNLIIKPITQLNLIELIDPL